VSDEKNLKCIKCNVVWSSDKPRQFSKCPECSSSDIFIVEYVDKDYMQ